MSMYWNANPLCPHSLSVGWQSPGLPKHNSVRCSLAYAAFLFRYVCLHGKSSAIGISGQLHVLRMSSSMRKREGEDVTPGCDGYELDAGDHIAHW